MKVSRVLSQENTLEEGPLHSLIVVRGQNGEKFIVCGQHMEPKNFLRR